MTRSTNINQNALVKAVVDRPAKERERRHTKMPELFHDAIVDSSGDIVLRPGDIAIPPPMSTIAFEPGDRLVCLKQGQSVVVIGNLTNPGGGSGGEALGGENLNSILVPGTYYQSFNWNATLANNYPLANATGVLEVFWDGGQQGYQRYTPHGELGRVFYERVWWQPYAEPWLPWQKFEASPDWQAYAVSLYSATGGTNPTLGNSTIIGRYRQQGKTVDLNIYAYFGSTFNPGTGLYGVTLPVPARVDVWQVLSVAASLNAPSAGEYMGVAKVEGANGVPRIHLRAAANVLDTLGGTGAPLTPVNGNRLTISGTYEAA